MVYDTDWPDTSWIYSVMQCTKHCIGMNYVTCPHCWGAGMVFRATNPYYISWGGGASTSNGYQFVRCNWCGGNGNLWLCPVCEEGDNT